MLISTEVEVGLGGDNCKHFEDLNYPIPRYIDKRGRLKVKHGTKIKVKAKDLEQSSSVKVIVKCDCPDCKRNNPYLPPMPWYNYLKCVKENNIYYCHECAMRLYGGEKQRQTKLKKGTSFERWCLDNNRQDVLNRWDYEKNNCKPSEITYRTGKRHWFKCPRGIHNSELKYIANFTSGQDGAILCNYCNSITQWGIDNYGSDFLEKYWDYDKNEVNPWEIDYGAVKIKIWIFCQNEIKKHYHGSYDLAPNDFTSKIHINRCPYCSIRNGKVHPLDSLGILFPQTLNLWSKKNGIKTAFLYKPLSMEDVYWKCPDGKHEDYIRSINSSTPLDFRCPECVRERDESFLQEKVRLYLNSLGYKVLHENKCNIIAKNPKTKNNLPYDNEIEELKLIVEVHGSQHYIANGFHILHAKKFNTTPEYELHMLQVRDRYKRIFAKKRGYFYVEIPYFADDKKETWKKLINNKIQEIIK